MSPTIERAIRHLRAAGLEPTVGPDGEALWLATDKDLDIQLSLAGDDWLDISILLVEPDEVDDRLAATLVRENHRLVFGKFVVDRDDRHIGVYLEHVLYGPTLDHDELIVALQELAIAADAWYPRLAATMGEEQQPHSPEPISDSSLMRLLGELSISAESTDVSTAGVRLLAGETVGDYQIEDALGSGGFGTVYRARDLTLGRAVAVKVLHPAHASTPAGRARFLREARLAARVSHPFLVKVFAVGEDHDHLYITYDFIDGPTLAELAQDEFPLEPTRVSRFVGQLARAVQALHDVGVLHRDIKPVNALVWGPGSDDELVLLTDLGVGYDPDPDATRLTRPGYGAPGTVLYMAPEGLVGPVGPAGDQYSLAATAYELLTGAAPFADATSYSELAEWKLGGAEPLPVSELSAGVSPDVDRVLVRALARRPDDRYETIAAFARALDEAVGANAGPPQPPPPPTGLMPYVAWEARDELADPLTGSTRELADGLLDIVAVEGPVVCERAFRLYLAGAGRSQLSEQIRRRLARALSNLVRDEAVVIENEWKSRNLLDRVLRLPAQPRVALRDIGPRRLTDVPALEWVAAAEYVQQREGRALERDELVRSVARLYGRQRVGASLHDAIDWALDQYLV